MLDWACIEPIDQKSWLGAQHYPGNRLCFAEQVGFQQTAAVAKFVG